MNDPTPGAIDIWGFVIIGFTSVAGWLGWIEQKRSRGDQRLHARIDEANNKIEGIGKANEIVVNSIFREISAIRERLPEHYATRADIAALSAKMNNHETQTNSRFKDIAVSLERVITKLEIIDGDGVALRNKGKSSAPR